jgi:hypothetical protein
MDEYFDLRYFLYQLMKNSIIEFKFFYYGL